MSTTEVTSFPEAVLLIPKGNPATIAFCRNILASTDNNPDFTPKPEELTTLATDTDTYDKANANARGGGLAATKVLRAARKKVVADLKHVRDAVQTAAEKKATPADAAAVIVGAGLRIRKVTKRNKRPVDASQGPTSGSAWLEALRVARTACYFWVFSLDQKSWASAPETMKATLLVTGLTPGQTYYFKFRAITPKGPVDFSQVVSLLVQ
jgi:hypothetical protein